MRFFSLAGFLASVLCAVGAAAAEPVPIEVEQADSPNGKLTVTATVEKETTCHLEMKAHDQTVAKLDVPGYHAAEWGYSVQAWWKDDSSAVALNINLGPEITTCRVLVSNKGSWLELPLPKEPLEQARRRATRSDRPPRDLFYGEAWLSDQNFKVGYCGNLDATLFLVFHLVRSGKPHLDHLLTSITLQPANLLPAIHELPCFSQIFAGGVEGSADGPVATARFTGPSGLAIDSEDQVFVADQINNTLRRVTTSGAVETVAGATGERKEVDDHGSKARFNFPQALAIDTAGNVYVADTGGRSVRKVTPQGDVSTLADGFEYPAGLATDVQGNVYVADASNCVIQKIDHDGAVSVVAGKVGVSGAKNGRGEAARFRSPSGVATAPDGALYVADSSAIRKIDSKGNVTTFAGALDDPGRTDGHSAATARFWGLSAITRDHKGNLYVADNELKNLRCVSPKGVVRTLRTANHTDLVLQNPVALAVDAKDRVYVADQNAQTVLRIEPKEASDKTPR